jgi:diphthamide biosynthesis protein 4
MAVGRTQSARQTHYDVLGLPNDPSQVSLPHIKAAYHRALLNVHPDKSLGVSELDVDQVREAWRVLSDDASRKAYDSKLEGFSIEMTF